MPKDIPKFERMTMRDFRDLEPGFFVLVQISSDGKDFSIDWSEQVVPFLKPEVLEKIKLVLEKIKLVLEDSFYRLRPDLGTS